MTATNVKRRRWLWWLGLAAVPLLLVIGLWVALAFVGGSRLDRIKAKLDQEDPGWRWDDMVASRPAVVDEDNAVLYVQKVCKLMQQASVWSGDVNAASAVANPPVTLPTIGELPANVALYPEHVPTLQADLGAVVAAREAARKLAGMTRGRLELCTAAEASLQLDLSAVQRHRDVANLLQMDVCLLLHEGKRTEALEANRALFNLSYALRDEPFLLVHLVRWAIDSVALRNLERILGQSEPTEQELAALQAYLAERLRDRGFSAAIRGERAFTAALMEGEEGIVLGGGVPKNVLTQGWHKNNAGKLLEKLTEVVEVTKQPPHFQRLYFEKMETELKRDMSSTRTRLQNLYVLMGMPAFFKVMEAQQRVQAHMTCASAAVAAERYRRQHGQWPATIDDLVPLLGDLPIDPYDGLPLRLKILPDGVLLYSVGRDGKDNGGVLDANPMKPDTDQGFRVWDVKMRGVKPSAVDK